MGGLMLLLRRTCETQLEAGTCTLSFELGTSITFRAQDHPGKRCAEQYGVEWQIARNRSSQSGVRCKL